MTLLRSQSISQGLSRAWLGVASAGVIRSLAAGRWDDLGESEKASLACGLTGLQLGRHSRGPGLSLVSPGLSRIISLAGASDCFSTQGSGVSVLRIQRRATNLLALFQKLPRVAHAAFFRFHRTSSCSWCHAICSPSLKSAKSSAPWCVSTGKGHGREGAAHLLTGPRSLH